jgi:hypothetical protein
LRDVDARIFSRQAAQRWRCGQNYVPAAFYPQVKYLSVILLMKWALAEDYIFLERFQSKVLLMIVDSPWYVPNSLIRRDLSCPTVKEEISRYSSHYGDRLRTHPNHLAVNLLRLLDNRRLRRFLPTDLPDRF